MLLEDLELLELQWLLGHLVNLVDPVVSLLAVMLAVMGGPIFGFWAGEVGPRAVAVQSWQTTSNNGASGSMDMRDLVAQAAVRGVDAVVDGGICSQGHAGRTFLRRRCSGNDARARSLGNLDGRCAHAARSAQDQHGRACTPGVGHVARIRHCAPA